MSKPIIPTEAWIVGFKKSASEANITSSIATVTAGGGRLKVRFESGGNGLKGYAAYLTPELVSMINATIYTPGSLIEFIERDNIVTTLGF